MAGYRFSLKLSYADGTTICVASANAANQEIVRCSIRLAKAAGADGSHTDYNCWLGGSWSDDGYWMPDYGLD